MEVREKLVELLSKYFDIGDSYCYNLTRTKNAFACGTMGFDDFEEFDDETVADIADYLIANGVTVQEWISVKDRLPESGVHVLIACEMRGQYFRRRYVCDGYYAKAKTQPSYGNPDECAVEYSEEDDEYYLLEGWYEVIKNWDDFNSIVIDDFVTHWMPLPAPPKNIAKGDINDV